MANQEPSRYNLHKSELRNLFFLNQKLPANQQNVHILLLYMRLFYMSREFQ